MKKLPQVEVNLQTILLVIAVILLAANSVSTLTKGKKDWAELSGRSEREAETRAMKQRLHDLETWKVQVEHRLQQGNVRFDENSRDTTEILIVLRSIIKHMQSGNDHAKLQETDDKLYKYLVEKRGVSPSVLD